MCIIIHKWSKWKQYSLEGEPIKNLGFVKVTPSVEDMIPLAKAHPMAMRQRRVCARCDEMQDKPITDIKLG